MRVLTIGLIASLLLAAPGAYADTALGLEQALAEARQHNPELRKLQLAEDAAVWKRRESLAAYVPHLELKGSHLLGAEYGRLNVVFGGASVAFPEAFPQSQVDLDASWMIFDGFGVWGGLRAGNLEAEAAGL